MGPCFTRRWTALLSRPRNDGVFPVRHSSVAVSVRLRGAVPASGARSPHETGAPRLRRVWIARPVAHRPALHPRSRRRCAGRGGAHRRRDVPETLPAPADDGGGEASSWETVPDAFLKSARGVARYLITGRRDIRDEDAPSSGLRASTFCRPLRPFGCGCGAPPRGIIERSPRAAPRCGHRWPAPLFPSSAARASRRAIHLENARPYRAPPTGPDVRAVSPCRRSA